MTRRHLDWNMIPVQGLKHSRIIQRRDAGERVAPLVTDRSSTDILGCQILQDDLRQENDDTNRCGIPKAKDSS